jgi:cell division protein FtsW (lipid II flippase)
VSSITAPSPAVDPAGPQAPAARGRRRTELIMLVFAFALVAFAFANVGYSLKGKLPSGLAEYMAAFIVIVLVGHLALRRFAPWADPLLLPLAAMLNGLGIVMTYRLAAQGNLLSAPLSASATDIQILYSAIGIACFVAVLAFVREPRVLQRYTYTLGALGIALIALPALLPGSISEVAGAKIQIRLGSFTIQPEEFAKLALAISFAGYLVAKSQALALVGRRVLGIGLPRARDLGPILMVWAASLLLLVFESDVGTSAVFMGLFVAMLYIATGRRSWAILGFLLFVAGAFLTAKLVPHVGVRFSVWLDPFSNANLLQGNQPSYQTAQGLYGLGNGGLLGKGLGNGQPFWTPLVQSDEIFTAFGEELGLTGVMALLLLYGLFVQRGLRTAMLVKDDYSKLLASGLSFMFALQVFVIVGGVTNLIPFAGITTPFLSQGGSSLISSWLLVAVLARMSDTARRPAPKPIQDEGMTQVVSLR